MKTNTSSQTPHDNHILIVDDEVDILDILSDVLKAAGYECATAGDGQEAIDILEERSFATIITDIKMPRKDGIAVLKAAKALDDDCAVILLTGYASLDTAIQAVHLGAQDYLTKPFDVQNVLRVVERVLQHRSLVRENRQLHKETRRQRDELAKRVVELNILRELGVKFSFTFDYAKIFRLIFNSLSQALDYQVCAVLDFTKRRVIIRSEATLPEDENTSLIRSMLSELHKEVQESVGSEADYAVEYIGESLFSSLPEPLKEGFNIILPGEDAPFGVMNVSRYKDMPFSDDDVHFVRDLAKQTATVFKQLKSVVDSHRAQLQCIIDALPDGLVMIDPDADHILANPTAREILLGDGADTVTADILEAALGQSMTQLSNSLSTAGRPMIFDVTVSPKEGIARQYAGHAAMLPKTGGLLQGVVMILRDVTQDRQLEQMQKRWLTTLSHELRAPTAVLKEFVGLLRSELQPVVTEAIDEYMDVTESNVERLSRLIENLLHAANKERGDIPIATRDVDLIEHLLQQQANLEEAVKKQDISLKFQLPDSPLQLETDPEAVDQILANLLENACKFSPPDTTVTITVEEADEAIILSVIDQGRGIPHAQQSKIFDRFYRYNPPDELQIEGTGLGLSIVRDLVERQGGEVAVESAPDKGSTFRITLLRTAEIQATTPSLIGN